jgi:hypothetical protein
MFRSILAVLPALLSLTVPLRAETDDLFPFDQPEPIIQASPPTDLDLALPGVALIGPAAVSPVTSDVAFAVTLDGGRQELRVWNMASRTFSTLKGAPDGITAIAWHPVQGNVLFVSIGADIYRLEAAAGPAAARPDRDRKILHAARIWAGQRPVTGLAVGPRPFLLDFSHASYRLFFGERQADGAGWLRTVAETGIGVYTVAMPHPPQAAPDAATPESPAPLDAALNGVAAFHPGGNEMLARNGSGCPVRLDYTMGGWNIPGPSSPGRGRFDLSGTDCGEQLQFSPNGLYLLRWKAHRPGVEVQEPAPDTGGNQRSDILFSGEPKITADGRGVVGAVRNAAGLSLRYARLALELPDVADAWMFVRDRDDLAHLTRDGGMFKPIGLHQLYELYDSESYYCGRYSFQTATRPYMITTDVFWELYAASYEGLFTLIERTRAVPAFRKMVAAAAADLLARAPQARVTKAFATALAVLDNDRNLPEAARIGDANGTAASESLGIDLDYTLYAARGHYTHDEALRRYFAAAAFLTRSKFAASDIALLHASPSPVATAAKQWFGAYTAFAAPARGPDAFSAAASGAGTLFPLAFGADNVVLEGTLEHNTASGAPGGFALPLDGRTLPSGLDIAAAFGSRAAWQALNSAGEFGRYPSLPGRLLELRRGVRGGGDGNGIYAAWLRGLAVQWADNASQPISGPLWDAKRLQTGLASWATLRHATVLVNEVEGAECGGPGAEPIVMRPPRGQVEPDPDTFDAIAGLFRQTEGLVRSLYPPSDPLGQGILRRLEQSRGDARKFADMARRHGAGQALTPRDYADINFAGQAVEHNFKVFLSLMRDDEALVEPDPVDKIAEVAGGPLTGWLEAAVGEVLEWDQVAPAFGRHDIFKGVSYSYYEFPAASPMSDAEWRGMRARPARPAWLAPFFGRPIAMEPAGDSGEPVPP